MPFDHRLKQFSLSSPSRIRQHQRCLLRVPCLLMQQQQHLQRRPQHLWQMVLKKVVKWRMTRPAINNKCRHPLPLKPRRCFQHGMAQSRMRTCPAAEAEEEAGEEEAVEDEAVLAVEAVVVVGLVWQRRQH